MNTKHNALYENLVLAQKQNLMRVEGAKKQVFNEIAKLATTNNQEFFLQFEKSIESIIELSFCKYQIGYLFNDNTEKVAPFFDREKAKIFYPRNVLTPIRNGLCEEDLDIMATQLFEFVYNMEHENAHALNFLYRAGHLLPQNQKKLLNLQASALDCKFEFVKQLGFSDKACQACSMFSKFSFFTNPHEVFAYKRASLLTEKFFGEMQQHFEQNLEKTNQNVAISTLVSLCIEKAHARTQSLEENLKKLPAFIETMTPITQTMCSSFANKIVSTPNHEINQKEMMVLMMIEKLYNPEIVSQLIAYNQNHTTAESKENVNFWQSLQDSNRQKTKNFSPTKTSTTQTQNKKPCEIEEEINR